MKHLNDFTGLYSLSKTLRFELKPIGKTREHIDGLLEQDNHRADSYKQVKKIIDEYHKAFIEKSLQSVHLDKLDEYNDLYKLSSKSEKQAKDFESVKEDLRKQIADQFSKSDDFKRIFSKELIKEDLLKFTKEKEEDYNLVKEFSDFTTYFSGFHENRKNMYTPEDRSTAIAFRLINQNLPKFIDNISVFEKIAKSQVSEHFDELYHNVEEYLNVNSIADLFTLEYYSDVLTQKQIDVYNMIIGGRVAEGEKKKIQGLNEYVNLYNQKQTDRNNRLPKLKPLYKQILSDRNAIFWLPEEFSTDKETLEGIENCYCELVQNVFDNYKEGERSLQYYLKNLKDFNLNGIYLRNDTSLTEISQKLYGAWNFLSYAVGHDFELNNERKKKESAEQFEDRKEKYIKSFDSFSIAYLDKCLSQLDSEYPAVETYFASLGAVKTENEQKDNLFVRIEKAHAQVNDLLNTPFPEEKDLAQEKDNVFKIKDFLDSLKDLQFFVKPLIGKGNESEKDEKFYGEFLALWEELDKVTPLYNKVRNRMTRKPYSEEKIKLNFENSTLLNGWDLNKEPDNTSVILRKDGLYYLGIMNKKYNKIFKSGDLPTSGECYQKMEYKLLPGANKMLPKVFFSKSRIKEFAPSELIMKNYQNNTHKKGPNFNIEDCRALIDFFKASIQKHEDWKQFGFKFSDTNTYDDLSGFYREVEQQGYKLSFVNVPVSYISEMVEDGKLFLFQIYNKDFSPFSKGTPNMHTLYWKMLFDEQNLNDLVYKLNGEAEVFYRKSSIKRENIVKHPACQPVNNKNSLNAKKQSLFEYDLIKDRRYTVEKFQFHVPITMNFKSAGRNVINLQVNEFIRHGGVEHIIGIDRGERHLLYLTVIDLKGQIKEQYSLNEIVNEYNGNTYKTNYHDLLDKREGDRTRQRQDWATIENIKDLKQGYLSQVIHKIAQLIVKYNAIVVLEDLNFGFKQGRQKVEKSVYQQFEKMLIDKLNYLVDKKAAANEPGGVLKAYQFTNKFDSFQKLGKQCGFLYYIPAWNTSKMDPVTGFVNLFDTRYESVEKAKVFFSNFAKIRFNSEKHYFEFVVDDYTKFSSKTADTRQNWVICTQGTRIETFRNSEKNNEWDSREYDLTECFEELFKEKHIDVNGNLKDAIAQQTEKAFFDKLVYLFRMTLQMRNSKTGTDIDYLISPVANEKGEFYDSRYCGNALPENADANGAYNIARKGLWVIQQIQQTEDLQKLRLAITNKEWMQFAQQKPYLN